MLTFSKRYLEMEQAAHRGTGGISAENGHLGFIPAFKDTRTGKVYPSMVCRTTWSLPATVREDPRTSSEPSLQDLL